MFEALFSRREVLSRHRQGPLAQARERYLLHCVKQGYARGTLVRIAREVLVIAERIRVDRGEVSLQQIETAAERWACYQRRHKRADTSYWPRQLFVATAISWFRFLSWLRQPDSKTSPFAVQLEQFVAFMRDERGLSAATIRNRCWHLEKFLESLPSRKNSLAKVCLPEVDAYLARRGDHGWSRVSMGTAAAALRSFFRYAESRHWCARGIYAGIDGPRLFAQEGLPRGPDWQVVQRLITDAAEGRNPKDIRDHAILMLLCLYGLRSGEVARLRLDDVDWEHESLCVTRPKQRCAQHYPLEYAVGEAILRYLRQVRPQCARRELFLTLAAPFRPLSGGGMYDVVSRRLERLGWHNQGRGPHCLRHACAGHLLASGFSLKQIGDHLGHRSANTTRTYAKIDLPRLRQVAELDLGGLL